MSTGQLCNIDAPLTTTAMPRMTYKKEPDAYTRLTKRCSCASGNQSRRFTSRPTFSQPPHATNQPASQTNKQATNQPNKRATNRAGARPHAARPWGACELKVNVRKPRSQKVGGWAWWKGQGSTTNPSQVGRLKSPRKDHFSGPVTTWLHGALCKGPRIRIQPEFVSFGP